MGTVKSVYLQEILMKGKHQLRLSELITIERFSFEYRKVIGFAPLRYTIGLKN